MESYALHPPLEYRQHNRPNVFNATWEITVRDFADVRLLGQGMHYLYDPTSGDQHFEEQKIHPPLHSADAPTSVRHRVSGPMKNGDSDRPREVLCVLTRVLKVREISIEPSAL